MNFPGRHDEARLEDKLYTLEQLKNTNEIEIFRLQHEIEEYDKQIEEIKSKLSE